MVFAAAEKRCCELSDRIVDYFAIQRNGKHHRLIHLIFFGGYEEMSKRYASEQETEHVVLCYRRVTQHESSLCNLALGCGKMSPETAARYLNGLVEWNATTDSSR